MGGAERGEEPGHGPGDEAAPEDDEGADDGGLDLTLKKKKKKKKPAEEVDDFAAKVAALDLKDGEEADDEPAAEQGSGNWEDGTGIWAHDAVVVMPYKPLADRFFALLEERNPDHASGGVRTSLTPNEWAAFSNAAWALVGAINSGCLTPRSWRA